MQQIMLTFLLIYSMRPTVLCPGPPPIMENNTGCYMEKFHASNSSKENF